MADWLRRLSGKRSFEKLWLPLLRAKLGENYLMASAAFIWAIIARMYAARRTGLKKEMFGYVPGGYARSLERFAQVLAQEHVQIRLKHRAKRIESLHANEIGIEFESGHKELFDRVVLTMAAPVAAGLCVGLSEEENRRLLGIR